MPGVHKTLELTFVFGFEVLCTSKPKAAGSSARPLGCTNHA